MADLAITIEGERVSRLIDPRTGALAKGTALTAVMGPTATESFALSEALFVSGLESMPALNKAFPRYHLLIIPDTEPLEIWISRDAAPFFRPSPEWTDRIRIGTPAAPDPMNDSIETDLPAAHDGTPPIDDDNQ
jgi:hypothetical protein